MCCSKKLSDRTRNKTFLISRDTQLLKFRKSHLSLVFVTFYRKPFCFSMWNANIRKPKSSFSFNFCILNNIYSPELFHCSSKIVGLSIVEQMKPSSIFFPGIIISWTIFLLGSISKTIPNSFELLFSFILTFFVIPLLTIIAFDYLYISKHFYDSR